MSEFNTGYNFDPKKLYKQTREREQEKPPFQDERERLEELRLNEQDGRSEFFEAFLNSNGLDVGKNGYFSTYHETDEDERSENTSILGTPIHMPVEINGVRLPNEPLVTITGDKKIIRTSITGVKSSASTVRRGTIKELINTNDYKIKIVGRIVNEKDSEAYPEELVNELKKIYERRETVEISSDLTRIFEINQIAIYKLTLPGEAGMLNSQQYEILAYSDETVKRDKLTLGLEVESGATENENSSNR